MDEAADGRGSVAVAVGESQVQVWRGSKRKCKSRLSKEEQRGRCLACQEPRSTGSSLLLLNTGTESLVRVPST